MGIINHLSYSASYLPKSHHQRGEMEVLLGYVMFKSPSSRAGSELETTILGSRLVSFIVSST